jgi:hypothetical protein
MKMEQCSETSAYKIHTPGNYPEESIQHSEKGEKLKSIIYAYFTRYKKGKGKGKAVPLQAWSGPERPRKLRFPDYMTTAQDGVKVVSLTHRPSLPPRNAPGTHFC